jgi:hypothetical protein
MGGAQIRALPALPIHDPRLLDDDYESKTWLCTLVSDAADLRLPLRYI